MKVVGKSLFSLFKKYFNQFIVPDGHSLIDQHWLSIDLSNIYFFEEDMFLYCEGRETRELFRFSFINEICFEEVIELPYEYSVFSVKEKCTFYSKVKIKIPILLKTLTAMLVLIHNSRSSIFHFLAKIIFLELMDLSWDFSKLYEIMNTIDLTNNTGIMVEIYQLINISIANNQILFYDKLSHIHVE